MAESTSQIVLSLTSVAEFSVATSSLFTTTLESNLYGVPSIRLGYESLFGTHSGVASSPWSSPISSKRILPSYSLTDTEQFDPSSQYQDRPYGYHPLYQLYTGLCHMENNMHNLLILHLWEATIWKYAVIFRSTQNDCFSMVANNARSSKACVFITTNAIYFIDTYYTYYYDITTVANSISCISTFSSWSLDLWPPSFRFTNSVFSGHFTTNLCAWNLTTSCQFTIYWNELYGFNIFTTWSNIDLWATIVQ